ncbi:SAM-dependent methyltransferase [Oceanirhabdus sp. W0125-5]|uniref:SAM-dependent methyltransferase n=1 Tax=Oceanirhabdus sp. W0125-5 TaxID=2999116 RepID=UPI0022F2E091|nr:methyltransferase domain-containing protein [Oceanirhabdus sp. W0125-5]WBW97801.1 methyltransferase domain-containing protein [Oceanirhabdus sp. W0125-5]
MKYSKKELQRELTLPQFPLSAKYDIEWVNENEMGPNSMWLVEFLLNKMKLRNGMKVLDLGCGKALTSIFLAKEFGVKVWAADLWIGATENYQRIKEQGVDDLVYPIHADAHSLPFAHGFFDAIVSIDAYHYFGTNEMYLESLIRYLKPNGQIGIVVPSVHKEFDSKVPENLKPYWEPYLFTHHSPNWWKELWERSETVTVQVADTMPNGYDNWLKWDKTLKEAGILKRNGDVEMLEADGGNFTFARIVANKK